MPTVTVAQVVSDGVAGATGAHVVADRVHADLLTVVSQRSSSRTLVQIWTT